MSLNSHKSAFFESGGSQGLSLSFAEMFWYFSLSECRSPIPDHITKRNELSNQEHGYSQPASRKPFLVCQDLFWATLCSADSGALQEDTEPSQKHEMVSVSWTTGILGDRLGTDGFAWSAAGLSLELCSPVEEGVWSCAHLCLKCAPHRQPWATSPHSSGEAASPPSPALSV